MKGSELPPTTPWARAVVGSKLGSETVTFRWAFTERRLLRLASEGSLLRSQRVTLASESSLCVTWIDSGARVLTLYRVRSIAWVLRAARTLAITRMPITTAVITTLRVPKRDCRLETRSRAAVGSRIT